MVIIENCICRNELQLTWNDNEKFKTIRCPKCNNEMRFKNPNLEKENLSDDNLKKIVEMVIGNDDPFWNQIIYKTVRKIIDLSNGSESTITELLGDTQFTSKQLFDIYDAINKVCAKLYIDLDFSKNKDKFVGLPYNLTFIKKQKIH